MTIYHAYTTLSFPHCFAATLRATEAAWLFERCLWHPETSNFCCNELKIILLFNFNEVLINQESMKTKLIVCALTSLLSVGVLILNAQYEDGFNYLNVEALAQCENHEGHCKEYDGDCVGVCPQCGQLIWADGHKGPAYNLSGNFIGHQTE